MKFAAIFNEDIEIMCDACLIAQDKDFFDNVIYKTKYWSVYQDTVIAYPGLVVISPMRHIYSVAGMSDKELKELFFLTLKVKEALQLIFRCDNFLYTFHEKQGLHLSLKIIPVHGLIELKNESISLSEKVKEKLRNNSKNMEILNVAIEKMRDFFSLIKAPF